MLHPITGASGIVLSTVFSLFYYSRVCAPAKHAMPAGEIFTVTNCPDCLRKTDQPVILPISRLFPNGPTPRKDVKYLALPQFLTPMPRAHQQENALFLP
jgi:hypothetical protein